MAEIQAVNGWRTDPMYTIGEAAKLAHVSSSTVRRWLYGYNPTPQNPDQVKPPVFAPTDASPYVSFLQLVEIVIASDFRKAGKIPLAHVRWAHEELRRREAIEYPFAHVRLEVLGRQIIQLLSENKAVTLGAPVQYVLSGLLERRVHEIVYLDDLAAKWYPAGMTTPIVIDPLYSAGAPTVAGRGVTIRTILRRWKSDQPIAFIADDLSLEPSVVERVLQYADKIAA